MRNTHLTAWFKLNTEDPNAREFLYTEIPHHYVFNDRAKKWIPRQRGGDRIISRMYSVNPADPEKFHLRLLLLHVPGATSYDDLKTVSGEVCLTFRDACIRRHLLTDDSEYNDALMEASQFQMPRQLRSMFATICTYCQPSDPSYHRTGSSICRYRRRTPEMSPGSHRPKSKTIKRNTVDNSH